MERARARGRQMSPRSGAPPTCRGRLYTVGGASGGAGLAARRPLHRAVRWSRDARVISGFAPCLPHTRVSRASNFLVIATSHSCFEIYSQEKTRQFLCII